MWSVDDRDLAAARASLERMCSHADLRRVAIRRLMDSIELANRLAPESWAVTRFDNGFRLNVGLVEAFACMNGRVLLLLSCQVSEVQAEGVEPIRYASVPGPQAVFAGTLAALAAVSSTLDPYHAEYVRNAALTGDGKPRRCRYARYHSQVLVDEARRQLAQLSGAGNCDTGPQGDGADQVHHQMRQTHSPDASSKDLLNFSGRSSEVLSHPHDPPRLTGSGLAGFYNGYSWAERMRKYEEMGRRIACGDIPPPRGPCRLCGDPGDDGGVQFEYHDEDYSPEYTWSEPAAYVLCRHCHRQRVHMRFSQPIAWQAFLAHVRRGGYARDLQLAVIRFELDAYRRALRTGGTPPTLRALRPYLLDPGKEWFAKLSLDWNDMVRRGSSSAGEKEVL